MKGAAGQGQTYSDSLLAHVRMHSSTIAVICRPHERFGHLRRLLGRWIDGAAPKPGVTTASSPSNTRGEQTTMDQADWLNASHFGSIQQLPPSRCALWWWPIREARLNLLRFFRLLWTTADAINLFVSCKWISVSVPTDGSEGMRTVVVDCHPPLIMERCVTCRLTPLNINRHCRDQKTRSRHPVCGTFEPSPPRIICKVALATVERLTTAKEPHEELRVQITLEDR
ncbi:hypothetical protein TcWFU_008302 [Taenia crassiceps]|uniref:Uncharacterized protein n=1 Tax=Taenia crassiceps TaxID=6207 RepID=A0ABR4Q8J0_9CEST